MMRVSVLRAYLGPSETCELEESSKDRNARRAMALHAPRRGQDRPIVAVLNARGSAVRPAREVPPAKNGCVSDVYSVLKQKCGLRRSARKHRIG